MKLPAIENLIKGIFQTFLRFPLALLSAIIGSIISIYIIGLEHQKLKDYQYLNNIVIICTLGLTLFLSITLYSERKNLTQLPKNILGLIGVFLLFGYYSILPEKLNLIHGVRSLLLGIGLHFLVAFVPFTGKAELTGFWQFNKALFLRILTAILFSGVLFVGLSLAMTAIEHLFSIKIDYKNYLRLWVFITGIFNTWFFLAGVPKDFYELNHSEDYPKGLKIFTQYVLIPLVTIYLIILYCYTAKIILEWKWPIGWVSYLVLGFSFLGILSQLLVYPIRDKSENKWIKTYSKWFYWALFPLIILLFLAIWKRISDYGVTENRYFVLILALWLNGNSIYLLTNKVQNIKMIPVSLCLIAFLSSFGPWGAFGISKNSQLNRLEQFLTEHSILVTGKIQKVTYDVPFDDTKEISSIVNYLIDVHGHHVLQPMFNQSLDSLFIDSSEQYGQKPTKIMNLMGLNFINKWQTQEQSYFSYSINNYNAQEILDIKGFDYYFNYNAYLHTASKSLTSYRIQDDVLEISYAPLEQLLHFIINDTVNIDVDLKLFVKKLMEKSPKYNNINMSLQDMVVDSENNNVKIKMIVKALNGNHSKLEDKFQITHVQANIFLKIEEFKK